jgi:hypothetical protein
MKRTRAELQAKVAIDQQAIMREAIRYQNELSHCTAVLVQLRLLELADENPKITKFSFDAEYEYDDEGSYFWCVTFWEHEEEIGPDVIYEELDHIGPGQEEVQIAFLSDNYFEGEITVAKLREIYADQIV